MTHYEETIDLEPVYLYLFSRLPIRQLSDLENWRQLAGSFEKLCIASENELTELGMGRELILKLREIKTEHSVEKIYSDLQKTGTQTLCYFESEYPPLLKEVFDPPPVLFYRGKSITKLSKPSIAIVGSRKMSSYGLAILPKLIGPLVKAELNIVSGLALGIDGAAHVETLKQNGTTISVLGSGVNEATVYPRGHFILSEQILENGGLLISEHPPFTPALKHHFVARNRIIAGLSLGIVVPECKVKSGALITADYAADFNRALYAIPGPAYSSLSEGPHMLIRNGAALITKGEEILDDLGIDSAKINEQKFNKTELLMLKLMQDSPATIDSLSELTKLDAGTIMQTLTMMELRGAIKNIGAQGFIKMQ